jgi:hypothetical protein
MLEQLSTVYSYITEKMPNNQQQLATITYSISKNG